jgi:hypothetical protein
VEYTACKKRIKGESQNIRRKVPENELTDSFGVAQTVPKIESLNHRIIESLQTLRIQHEDSMSK